MKINLDKPVDVPKVKLNDPLIADLNLQVFGI